MGKTEHNLDLLSERYEACELAYFDCLCKTTDRDSLASAAQATAEAAKALLEAAYPAFGALRDELGEYSREVIQKEIEAEQAELLFELWSDIHDAYRGECSHFDSRRAKPT